MKTFFVAMLALACAGSLAAQSWDEDTLSIRLQQLDKSLHYQTGEIRLSGVEATLHLPPAYRFLPPADAERVLSEGWGNPPGRRALGMIVPASLSPLEEHGWGVIVTFRDDGYIKDGDADDINYDELLRQMQQDTRDRNAERERAGYGALTLVGWATRPHYDAATHKLYWARELAEAGSNSRTLNYDVRVLGRGGVLSLNAVAELTELPSIERDMQQVLGAVEFQQGHRYSDFMRGDKVAAYGIGALVAGTYAAKAGLFKGLLVALLALKKFVVVAFAGVIAFIRKLFGGKGKEPGTAPQ